MFTLIFKDLRRALSSAHSKSLNVSFIFKSFALLLASVSSAYAQNTVQAIEQQTDILVIAIYCIMFAFGFMSGQQR